MKFLPDVNILLIDEQLCSNKKKWEWKYENDEFFRRDILFYQKTSFEWDKITEINN